MGRQYFEHHILFVYVITLLNSTSVSEDMINSGSRALSEYVNRFEILYGQRTQTCNIHLLLHLANNVREFDPLWVMSCFSFENLNGIIKSYVHGTKYAALQIYSAVSAFLSPHELKTKLLRPDWAAFELCK